MTTSTNSTYNTINKPKVFKYILFNSRLKTGITLINVINEGKFAGLLSRLCTALGSSQSPIFSDEQKSKLQTSLNLSSEKIECIIDVLIDIILKVCNDNFNLHVD